MKIGIACLLTFFLTACFGCMSTQKRHVDITTERDDPAAVIALIKSVDTKIQYINRVSEQEDLSNDDREIALELLSTYQALQKKLSDYPGGSNCLSIIEDIYRRLSMLDATYFSSSRADDADVIRVYTRRKSDIMGAYLSGDLKGVIELCIQLKSVFGPDSITPDIGLVFAISLASRGMLDEAINIGEKMARRLETEPDPIQLRTHIAEWYLQQEQREKAISIYEKLSDTCDENEFTIRSLNKQIVDSQMYKPRIEPVISDPIQLERLEVGIDPLLVEVGKSLEENRFSEARNLLVSMRRRSLKADEIARVNQALKKVEIAENDYLEKKISIISMKRDLEQARNLLEEERYEEVIDRLEALEIETGDINEVTELKQFAIDKLIIRERNSAAGIFLAAKKTRDLEEKEAYLLEALDILNNTLSKYTSSTLNDKLKSNIETVRVELKKLPFKAGEKSDP